MVGLHGGDKHDVGAVDPDFDVFPFVGGEVDDLQLVHGIADLSAGDGLSALGGVGGIGEARGGVGGELGKKIVRILKDGKLKVQASIQGEAVRVSGAKRDVLQEAIALVRKSVTDVPLQFNNFRD